MSALAAISVASAKGAYRFILLAVEMQCALSVTLSQCLEARMRSKVSGCKIPFPRLLVCRVPTAPDFEWPLGFEPRHFSRFGWDSSTRRRKTNKQGWTVPYARRASGV
jgi:hypothetical protein